MTPREAAIAALVASAPPLTTEQAALLAGLLGIRTANREVEE